MARNKIASQSSESYGGIPSRAVDGNHNTDFSSGSCSQTNEGSAKPWWYVDLGQQYLIESVALTNRGDMGG